MNNMSIFINNTYTFGQSTIINIVINKCIHNINITLQFQTINMDDQITNDNIFEQYDDDGYDSSNEIDIEVVDYENGNACTKVYSVPYKPTYSNRKRLICFSLINEEKCIYNSKCTYAHSFEEQIIDEDRCHTYKIILDKNLMNFYSQINPKTEEIYKNLLFMTHICDQCQQKKCTGAYNCRNGVFNTSLKICKNDLLSGGCLNKTINITIDKKLLDKIKLNNTETNNFQPSEIYEGCINGHHLTQRKLIPYYKHIQQKENTKKNEYHSIRYIDINPINKIFRDNNSNSEESTDEELDDIFSKHNNNDTNTNIMNSHSSSSSHDDENNDNDNVQ